MFAQNNKSNIIPFSHFGYDRNEAVEINYRRGSSVSTLSEDILQLVWNNIGVGMCITDSDGIIVSVNSAFCSLIHMSEIELIGKEFTVMYSPDVEKDKLRKIYSRTLASGSYQKKYEKVFHLHDNTTIEVEITKTELVDDAEERYLLTEYRDISERMNWERNVQESELNYRSLFDHAVMPMYQSSVEGRFVNANNSMLKLLGYDSFSELRNINIDTELYLDLKQREEVVETMSLNKEIKGKELQLRKKNGSIIHVLLYSRAITVDSGTVSGFEGTLEDITFRKEADEMNSKLVTALESMRKELIKTNSQYDAISDILYKVRGAVHDPLSAQLFEELLPKSFKQKE